MPGLRRIISGAQTGVDRAGIDAAIESLVYSWGGSVPRGRLDEDGEIPERYFKAGRPDCGLQENVKSRDYKARTLKNIKDSDATMVLHIRGPGRVKGPGTKLTIATCRKQEKPYRIFDPTKTHTVPRAVQWICETEIQTDADGLEFRPLEILNVAGDRESGAPGIYKQSLIFLRDVFTYVFTYQRWGIKIWAPRKPNK